MTFTLDTSGGVPIIGPKDWPAGCLNWPDLSPFAQGYVTAAFAELWKARHASAATACEAQAAAMDRKIERHLSGWEHEQHQINKLRIRAQRHRGKAAEGCRKNQIPGGPGFSDLAPATLAAMLKDCEAFPFLFPGHPKSHSLGQTFWRDRAEWACPDFPPLTLYLADDGLIYQREAS